MCAQFSLDHLVKNINRGDVALPDIQRPFVWPNRKVRDLLDSMYKGFPVGYLLFWATGDGRRATGAEAGARTIGVVPKDESVPHWLIVDGQQRLTSLYAIFTGHEVVHDDYSSSRIRIAFNSLQERFEVFDAAIERDPEFLADGTPLWGTQWLATVGGYEKRLEHARGELGVAERTEVAERFERVRNPSAYPFQVVELDASMNEEDVAGVIVRINSEGISLNQSDFLLTLMRVFRDKARRQLEDFCRSARTPVGVGASANAFNWYLEPHPDQLLRVAVAVAFRRAVLQHVYLLLRGKDLETGQFGAVGREQQFDRLQHAQDHVVDTLYRHEFFQCLERAGFRGSKMISSNTAILYSYALFLIGRVDYNVPLDQLREIIARWFFIAHTTGRYSGSFETRFESDAARLAMLDQGDAAGFVGLLEQIIEDTLTSDYWSITLPNDLATSASKSPALLAYIAALNILDADVLLSTAKVRSRLDPAITLKKGIERHHLFPKAYLRNVLGLTDIKRVNQIANFALVVWSDNIAISDVAPAIYWPSQLASKGLDGDCLARAACWHAMPTGWEQMAYDTFLAERRRMMANVVRDAFRRLADSGYEPAYAPGEAVAEAPISEPAIRQLLEEDLLVAGTQLVAEEGGASRSAILPPDGRLYAEGESYDTLLELSDALGIEQNPWKAWVAELAGAGARPRRAAHRRALSGLDVVPHRCKEVSPPPDAGARGSEG